MKLPSVDQTLKDYQTKTESSFLRQGKKNALALYQEMAKRVPAYKDYLRKQGIKSASVKTWRDFEKLPTINKENYLKQYELKDLCWDGKFTERDWLLSATSGSSGQPFYFPRTEEQDKQYAYSAELYLRSNFKIHKRKTLYVNGFAMGIWIGGVFTHQALEYIRASGKYALTVADAGTNKEEILNVINRFGENYDQVILGGYPPFVKEVIDEGLRRKMNWSKFNMKFVFSAEPFPEEFRNYIIKTVKAQDPLRDTLNHYGTVDLGTMAHETPLSILVRRVYGKRKRAIACLFKSDHRVPTFAQYDPRLFYFEDLSGALVCSARSGLPLVRYDLRDRGGVLTFDELNSHVKDFGETLPNLIRQYNIKDTVWNLPFVYVFERDDFVVSWYGANVYPQTIRKALQHRLLQPFCSSKFAMLIEYNKQHDQILSLHIELKTGTRPSQKLTRLCQEVIQDKLMKDNSEYRNSFTVSERATLPKITLHQEGDIEFFGAKGKHKWIIN